MSSKIVQVNFRMPEALKEALEDAARASYRSLTAEIVARLEFSLDEDLSVNDMIRDYYWLRKITDHLAAAVNRDSPTNPVDVETLNKLLKEMDESFQRSSGAGPDGEIQPEGKPKHPE